MSYCEECNNRLPENNICPDHPDADITVMKRQAYHSRYVDKPIVTSDALMEEAIKRAKTILDSSGTSAGPNEVVKIALSLIEMDKLK